MPTQNDTFNALRRTEFIIVLREIQDMSYKIRSEYCSGNRQALWKKRREEIIKKHNWTIKAYDKILKL